MQFVNSLMKTIILSTLLSLYFVVNSQAADTVEMNTWLIIIDTNN